MIEKLAQLHPEIALFITTCVVLALGLWRSSVVRAATPWVAGLGLAIAAFFSLRSPEGDGVLPQLLPYAKTLTALIGLAILPLLSGAVDRWYEREVRRGGAPFDPMRVTQGEFYAFFLFSLTGVMLCATADDLIWLFLALELTSLPTYVMVAMSTPRLRAQEAGVKYFFLGALSAATFLYGFALLYGATGATALTEIQTALAQGELSPMAVLGLVLAIAGVSFKIAAAPMHFYTPDVYQGAASPVSAYLAFAPKAAGFIVLIYLLATVGWSWGPEGAALPEAIRVLLWVMAAATMTIGNVLALLQRSVKRLLAYSSIAHSGYMVVGLIAGPGDGRIASNGLAATLFYLLCYGVMNMGAFAVLACLSRRNEQGEMEEADDFEDIRGLVSWRPGLAWAMTLCALSLLGLPPLLGFWGKLMLFTSIIAAGEIPLAIVLGVNSAIAAFYYLRLVATTMLEAPDPEVERPMLTSMRGRRLAAGLSAAGVVVVVIWTSSLQSASHRAAQVAPLRLVEASSPDAPVAARPDDAP